MTSTIEQSIDVQVPASTAYDQWTQFEEFPRFMETIEEVQQISERDLLWRARIGGRTEEWVAEIVEQIPDKRIAWRSLSGPRHAGVVTFHRLSDRETRVMVQMDYDPHGFAQHVADALGVTKRRIEAELERFKRFIEARGVETGAWRGSIPNRDEERSANFGEKGG